VNIFKVTPQRKGSLVLHLHDACLDDTDPYEVRVGLHDAAGVYLTIKDKVSWFSLYSCILKSKKKKSGLSLFSSLVFNCRLSTMRVMSSLLNPFNR